ncbi:hypothetical protein ACH4VT_30890 [Streptomyces lydicus]|uniref:hypothetical protein n=1 Tax=Streptomyces lydicus TaxID=47763 RepID=UPI00379CF349
MAADGHRRGPRRAQPSDLVVLDLMLPGMDRLEVCRHSRENGPLPVIMLTARGTGGPHPRPGAGADDYLIQTVQPARTRTQGAVGAAPCRSTGRSPEGTGRVPGARLTPWP